MEKLPDKTFHYVASYMLKGYAMEKNGIAEKYRAEGKVCSLYVKPKKMGKFLGKLEERGYKGFVNVSNGDEISLF